MFVGVFVLTSIVCKWNTKDFLFEAESIVAPSNEKSTKRMETTALLLLIIQVV